MSRLVSLREQPLRIKLFGHSMLRRLNSWGASRKLRNHQSGVATFYDLLADRYNMKGVDHHDLATSITCCSEERILYFIKKQGNPLDIVVILHSPFWFVFNPSFNRDFPLSHVTPHDIEDVRDHDEGWLYYPTAIRDRFLGDKYRGEPDDGKINKIITNYGRYFSSIDLQRNRYHGALIQIDQYLSAKNIYAIHLPWDRHHVPSWFTFTSGPVLHDLQEMAHSPAHWKTSYHASTNSVSPEGNQIIADAISEKIDEWLLSKKDTSKKKNK